MRKTLYFLYTKRMSLEQDCNNNPVTQSNL